MDVNKQVTILKGICKNVEVCIGPVATLASFLVVETASQPVILEMPFFNAGKMSMTAAGDGTCNMTITSSETGKVVSFQGVLKPNKKHKYLSTLFPNTERESLN